MNDEPKTITFTDIEAYVVEEYYLNLGAALGLPEDHPTRVMTKCILVLKNGFTLTGESGCADPRKYNEVLGRDIARADALKKLWPLMGYVLRSQLAGMTGLVEPVGPEAYKQRVKNEASQLEERLTKLRAFIDKGMEGVSTKEQRVLLNQRNSMADYLAALKERILNT